ncbi:MAG: hypothetical protein AEth_00867 [Candidatus Argoarchaeum ethanivorans]|uniref:Cyclase n=1 Tax=Candidatus Argoarchaeum ethanivorans TaxID=2608793 RepID=A0A8B3S3W1_9EURY|nr:MAG: hypothetical protein AEth_00867 [Candidatus Argoarchaeum ethanivorans]
MKISKKNPKKLSAPSGRSVLSHSDNTAYTLQSNALALSFGRNFACPQIVIRNREQRVKNKFCVSDTMKMFDLTMPIDTQIPVFPGGPEPEIIQVASIKEKGWNEKQITIGSHFSTHIDAPFHMIEDGKKLDDYPINKFIGIASVIDVRNQKLINPSLDEIEQEDIVFFYTAHINKIRYKEYFQQNPILSVETAQRLIEKKVKIVGLDSFSPDNEPFEIHKLLLKNDILIVENLINLDKLVNSRFMCYILPLKIMDADGAPCRVIGVLT